MSAVTIPPEIPAELRRLMAEIGPIWGTSVQAHVKLMVEKFSAVHASAIKQGRVTHDVAYGADRRQVLDIYQPPPDAPGAGTAVPVIVFVHGGAFVDGEKDRSSEIYSNVCWYFARHGVLAINLEFRLAPAFMFPSGTLDMAASVAWVQANIATYGGDASRIFMMGHSAGAAHAAHYAYDASFHPPGGNGLAGLVVVSGRVRSENGADNPNARRVEAYYGVDVDAMNRGSAVNYVTPDVTPTMIAVAEFENPLIDVHCAELFHLLAVAKRRAPRFVWMAGHNHTSIVAHINTAEAVLGRQILAFIADGR